MSECVETVSSVTPVILQARERYQQASGGVTERTRVLAEVSECTTFNSSIKSF